MESFKQRFTYVYDNKIWGDGSGGGSCKEFLAPYIKFVNQFVKENNIKTILDFGCGVSDFPLCINLEGANYIGVDVVESVITHNLEKYKSENIDYKLINDVSDIENINADLVLIKDVFQHWHYKEIESFLKKYSKKFKYILSTNRNNQFEDYQYYRLDPHLYAIGLNYKLKPLSLFNPELVLNLTENKHDIKEVILITWK